MTEKRKARLAKFILSRLVELATGMKLLWINLETGRAEFQFTPNDAQVASLVNELGGAG